MIVIRTKNFPFGKKYLAINIFGVIFTKQNLTPTQLNHEYIHSLQQWELLFVFFYLLYFIEWIFRLIQFRNFYRAYRNISFEREAYEQMFDLNYPKHRKLFSWINYYRHKAW